MLSMRGILSERYCDKNNLYLFIYDFVQKRGSYVGYLNFLQIAHP